MTKLDVIKANKKIYADVEKAIESMTGLEKAVAQNMTLAWAKGNNWMGGLPDAKANCAIEKLMAVGYDEMDIINEFNKQIMRFV